MTDENRDILDSTANEIKAMGADLRFHTGGHVIYTGLLFDKYLDIRARKYGTNRSRLDIMNALIIHGGVMKPSDLSKMLFRSRQSTTEIIDGLEKDGLVTRELLGKDRRTRRVIITRKGLELVKETIPLAVEVMNSGLPSLSQEQMEVLGSLLRQIRKHLFSQIAHYKGEK